MRIKWNTIVPLAAGAAVGLFLGKKFLPTSESGKRNLLVTVGSGAAVFLFVRWIMRRRGWKKAEKKWGTYVEYIQSPEGMMKTKRQLHHQKRWLALDRRRDRRRLARQRKRQSRKQVTWAPGVPGPGRR